MLAMQRQKSRGEISLSSNGKPFARCPEHPGLPPQTNPVFVCESCRRDYCPACAGRVWFTCQVGGQRIIWYRCPGCPIGLAFMLLPEYGALQPEAAMVRQGCYEALSDGEGTSILVLDGKERYLWLQKPDSVCLAADPPTTETAPITLQRGIYLVARSAGHTPAGAGLVLYLELPHGYQEYNLPEGWPEAGEAKPLQISPRALSRRQLERLLLHARRQAAQQEPTHR